MRQVVKFIGRLMGFAALAILLSFRIALAAVLTVVTPIILPFLALLSGGALLIAIGFASFGYWHDALKGVEACFGSSTAFIAFVSITQSVNPFAFKALVSIVDRPRKY